LQIDATGTLVTLAAGREMAKELSAWYHSKRRDDPIYTLDLKIQAARLCDDLGALPGARGLDGHAERELCEAESAIQRVGYWAPAVVAAHYDALVRLGIDGSRQDYVSGGTPMVSVYTVAEAAGVSPRAVQQAIANGRLGRPDLDVLRVPTPTGPMILVRAVYADPDAYRAAVGKPGRKRKE